MKKYIDKAFDALYGDCRDEVDYIKSTGLASILLTSSILLFLLFLEFIFSM